VSLDKIRNEQGAFVYRYEPCNVGNIRKMIILLPVLVPTGGHPGSENYHSVGYDNQGNVGLMTQKFWKPIRVIY
jgi:hypothetical protein